MRRIDTGLVCRMVAACAVTGAVVLASARAADQAPAAAGPYAQNFESLPQGKPPTGAAPDGFMLVSPNARFAITKEGGNAFFEIGPFPTETHAALFGPERVTAGTVSGRVQSWSTGKRFPEFGIGLGGVGGPKAWLMPRVNEVQIRQGEQVLARAPFEWKSGSWTRLKLSMAPGAGGKALLQAKAWADGGDEPKEWMAKAELAEAPSAGRACLATDPYAGTATRFDDLVVTAGK